MEKETKKQYCVRAVKSEVNLVKDLTGKSIQQVLNEAYEILINELTKDGDEYLIEEL